MGGPNARPQKVLVRYREMCVWSKMSCPVENAASALSHRVLDTSCLRRDALRRYALATLAIVQATRSVDEGDLQIIPIGFDDIRNERTFQAFKQTCFEWDGR